MRNQPIGPREIMAYKPCECSGWTSEVVHALFRNTLKKRTISLKDIPRLLRAKILDEDDSLWLYLRFAPKACIKELADDIRDDDQENIAGERVERGVWNILLAFEKRWSDEDVIEEFCDAARLHKALLKFFERMFSAIKM